jgi:squalene-associated FAD-dependent desaturase
LIVGGGIAGLSAAEALTRHHRDRFDVTIIESKRSAGGRAGSFDAAKSRSSASDPIPSEQIVDYCQHVAMGCCTNLINLMDRCGLSDAWRRHQSLHFLHPDFPESHFAPSTWLPAPLHLATTIGSLNYLSWKEQRTVRRGLLKLMRTPTNRLHEIAAATWLKQAGQSKGTIHKFWDVILVSALGEQTQRVSMAAARKVIIDGFAAAKGASDVLVPSAPLRQLFAQKLRDAIRKSGAKIETSHRVAAIKSNPVSVHGLKQCWAADHIVSAVPWHQIGKILTDDRARSAIENLAAFSDIPSSPITGVHLWFDREITSLPHAVLVGTLSQWLFRDPIPENPLDDKAGHYYQIVISASRDAKSMSQEALVQHVVFELQRLFPASSDAKLLHSQVVTDPNAVFSVRPEVEAIRPSAGTALPWLHLAGDWIATGWPATMEGAVISGIMAANSICQSEALSPLPIDTGLSKGWLARQLIAD